MLRLRQAMVSSTSADPLSSLYPLWAANPATTSMRLLPELLYIAPICRTRRYSARPGLQHAGRPVLMCPTAVWNARGLNEIPDIHEGVTAQALERKGIISDRTTSGS